MKSVYLDHEEFWADLPNLRELAGQVSPDNTRFVALDAPQLIKHTLGLMRAHGRSGFRLLYLYYDVPGPEAVRHSEEIAEFSRVMGRDGLMFQSITYQDVILEPGQAPAGRARGVRRLPGRTLPLRDQGGTQALRGPAPCPKENIPRRPDSDRRLRQASRFARILRVLEMIQGRAGTGSRRWPPELECLRTDHLPGPKNVLELAGVPWFHDQDDQRYRVRPGYNFPAMNLGRR